MSMRMKQLMTVSVIALAALGCRSSEGAEARPAPVEAASSAPAMSEPPPEKRTPIPAPPGQLDPRAVYNVPLDGTEPQKGPDDALMTIVEFGDFQCPYCARAAPTMDQLVEEFGDEVRVVWLNFPQENHRYARPAATAALEAQAQKGDEAFWKMHDKIFSNQGAMTRADLERYGEELGLNMRKLRRALDRDKYADVIDRQVALAKSLNVPGTPSWFMNGRFMSGFPFQTWVGAINRRMGAVRRMVDQGVTTAELYDRIVATGKTSP